MPSRPLFSEIEPLLADRKVDKERNTVQCVFVCPGTLRRVPAEAYIREGSGIKDRLVDSAARSFWYELRYSVARKVCSFLPSGFVREVAEGTAWRMAYSNNDHVTTESEIQDAVVEAFLSVRDQFEHDGQGWKAREVVTEFVTDFERQVREHPVTTRYEGDILARVLASVATLEGVEQTEAEFLAQFAPGAQVESTKAPSRVELSELRAEVKPTVYLLASAMAMADQVQSPEERGYLQQLERGLELPGDQAAELRRASGQFIVEQCLGLNEHPTQQEIAQLAKVAELSSDDVERVLVRRRKRMA